MGFPHLLKDPLLSNSTRFLHIIPRFSSGAMYDSTFPYDLRFEMQPSQGESAVLEKIILGTRGR